MKRIFCLVAICAFLLTAVALGDELRLRNGAVITGSYVGGDTRSIRFIGPDGNVQTYSVDDVAGIHFVTTSTSSVPAAPSASRTASSKPMFEVPAGTVITVRMIDSIDADITGAGERFRASIDDPISVDGRIVVPRHAAATVQVTRVEQGGAVRGSDEVALKLYDITVDGQAYQIATNYAEIKGEGKGGKTARNTAIGGLGGAIIGGILGGGRGAAIGAGAGAGAGVAVAAARGTKLRIPSESRLDFVLRAPLGLM